MLAMENEELGWRWNEVGHGHSIGSGSDDQQRYHLYRSPLVPRRPLSTLRVEGCVFVLVSIPIAAGALTGGSPVRRDRVRIDEAQQAHASRCEPDAGESRTPRIRT
jgi:hypothetical protein